ncbi:MAG: hypothetical protein OXI25_04595 [Chloroflexota bacterium]|nr:hypothetical protein [Chloroflexota bacterium]
MLELLNWPKRFLWNPWKDEEYYPNTCVGLLHILFVILPWYVFYLAWFVLWLVAVVVYYALIAVPVAIWKDIRGGKRK